MPHPLGTNKLPATPIKKFTVAEVRVAITKLRSTNAPGYDIITGEILKKLPEVGLSAYIHLQQHFTYWIFPWTVEGIPDCHNIETW